MSAFVIALALALSTACVALAAAHLRRVRRSTSPDLRALAASLKRVAPPSRAEELARRTPPESWEHRLAQSLFEAQTPNARVAAANDALAEIALTLSAGASWPGTAHRICVRGTLLIGLIVFLAQRSAENIVPLLAIGGVGGFACLAIGRLARREAKERREAIDALVAALVAPVVAPAPAP